MNKKCSWIFKSLVLISSCSYTCVMAARVSSPDEIQQELNAAQIEFNEAKLMFNPWYAGPLLTGSAHMMPPGSANIQPYIFVTDTYAVYNNHRKSKSIDSIVSLNPTFGLQTGITNWLDVTLGLQGFCNWQNSHSSGNIGDTNLALGIKILSETPYIPALKFIVKESFPSGEYEYLTPGRIGIDSTGSGAYQTTLTLNLGKVVWWLTLHPMSFRVSLNYALSSDVDVKGFNTYGGGYGTNGTVSPGNTFTGNLGYEFSFTQKWVAALDIAYVYSAKNKFSGNRGLTSTGDVAPVGGPDSDQLSLAPALEYNPNANLGFLAGVWFTVTGRNAADFVSGIVSVTYMF